MLSQFLLVLLFAVATTFSTTGDDRDANQQPKTLTPPQREKLLAVRERVWRDYLHHVFVRNRKRWAAANFLGPRHGNLRAPRRFVGQSGLAPRFGEVSFFKTLSLLKVHATLI
jgi:hypothetical protein